MVHMRHVYNMFATEETLWWKSSNEDVVVTVYNKFAGWTFLHTTWKIRQECGRSVGTIHLHYLLRTQDAGQVRVGGVERRGQEGWRRHHHRQQDSSRREEGVGHGEGWSAGSLQVATLYIVSVAPTLSHYNHTPFQRGRGLLTPPSIRPPSIFCSTTYLFRFEFAK